MKKIVPFIHFCENTASFGEASTESVYQQDRDKFLLAVKNEAVVDIIAIILKYPEECKDFQILWYKNIAKVDVIFFFWSYQIQIWLDEKAALQPCQLFITGNKKDLTNLDITDLTYTILEELKKKIQEDPSFATTLPPSLQNYYQDIIKPLGNDFGFLENYSVPETQTLSDAEFLQHCSKEGLGVSKEIITANENRLVQIVLNQPLKFQELYLWDKSYIIKVKLADKYIFEVMVGDLDNDHFNFYNFFLAGDVVIEVPRKDQSLLVNKFLNTLKEHLHHESSYWGQLPPPFQAYFNSDFKHIGSDFGLLETVKLSDQDFVTHIVNNTFSPFGEDLSGERARLKSIIYQHVDDLHFQSCTLEFDNNINEIELVFTLWDAEIEVDLANDKNFNPRQYFFEGDILPLEPEDTFKLHALILTLLRTALQQEPGLFVKLPVLLQNYVRMEFKHVGTDFNFFEKHHVLTSFTLFCEHQETDVEMAQRGLRAATRAINRDRDLDIIDIVLKYPDQWVNLKISQNRPRMNPDIIEFDFDLWTEHFSVWLDKYDLSFNDFYNGDYQVEVTNKQKEEFVTKFLANIQVLIQRQPGLWAELSPRLQDYYRDAFKEVGSDFDFLG
jgi:hypothetical protein